MYPAIRGNFHDTAFHPRHRHASQCVGTAQHCLRVPANADLPYALFVEATLDEKGGLDDLQGQSVSLSDFRGQAVFLDFWSRGCVPCIEDFPYLEQIKQQTQDQKVVFLSISLDSDAAWHQAVEKHGLTGVHVHSPGGWQAAVAQLYQIRSIPCYLLVGPDGLLAGRVDDVWDVEEVVSRIEEVASGKVPSSKSSQSWVLIKG